MDKKVLDKEEELDATKAKDTELAAWVDTAEEAAQNASLYHTKRSFPMAEPQVRPVLDLQRIFVAPETIT